MLNFTRDLQTPARRCWSSESDLGQRAVEIGKFGRVRSVEDALAWRFRPRVRGCQAVVNGTRHSLTADGAKPLMKPLCRETA